MEIDTAEFKALAADVAEIKDHLMRVRFDQTSMDVAVAVDGLEHFRRGWQAAASTRGRRRAPRRDRAPHLRPVRGEP